jgi:Na+-driven multidrug efflux pump
MKILSKSRIKDKNTKNIVTNIIYSFGVKGLSMLIALFTMPAYMQYFKNTEVLGIWFTILSVLAWILNCDMGIGNGLRNKLVNSLAENNSEKAKKYISSSYLFLTMLSIIIIVLLIIVSQFISWNRVFNISTYALSSRNLNKAMVILLLSIIFQFVLRLITSILYALQKSFVPGLLGFSTNAIMLIFVLICNMSNNNNNIIQLAIVYLIAVNLPLLITTIVVFKTSLKNSAPSIRYYQNDYAMSTLKIGGAFLWLQLMAMVLVNTDSYLITLFIGNNAVVQYQIYFRIFTLIGTLIILMTTPIWSAVTKAQAERKYIWIKNIYLKIAAVGGIAILAEFVLIVPLQTIFDFWLQSKTIQVNYGYAIVFAISGSLFVWSSVITCFANGLNELKIQTIFFTIGALFNIPMAYIFTQITNSYISIVIANIFSILPYCIVQTIWFHNYLKKKLTKR